ncbi:hypothetical protein ACQPZA_15770 [Pseudonocardia xinjiangensis]|uniref:hypothetical protein n=1 Tax=Pseudonocardia xinjiangensis TaxID=75289 RepID=UPI003D90E2D2
MRLPGATLVLLAVALTAGCAGEPSIDELSAGSGGVNGSGRTTAVLQRLGPPPGPPQPVPIEIPASPLAFFRAQQTSCSQYASLAGLGDPTYPGVEADRFSEAVLVRELDRDTALIEDGRGTRLVVDMWNTSGVVLPASGRPEDVMPAPYRLGCSPDDFIGTSG